MSYFSHFDSAQLSEPHNAMLHTNNLTRSFFRVKPNGNSANFHTFISVQLLLSVVSFDPNKYTTNCFASDCDDLVIVAFWIYYHHNHVFCGVDLQHKLYAWSNMYRVEVGIDWNYNVLLAVMDLWLIVSFECITLRRLY